MNQLLAEHALLITEIIGVGITLWRANRAINRYLDVLQQFPPHRHVDGMIAYPTGFEPGRVEHLGAAQ